MRINYLSPQGVLEVEHAALRELEQGLPSAWGAFAAFRLLTRGSKAPFDVDLLLLTTNRIMVVELKNLAGEIRYTDGQWIHKGTPSKSPVDVTDNKARALKDFLREKLPQGTKIPFIEGLVVLCHPTCRLIGFPDEQRRFVMMLPDFVKTGSDAGRYKNAFPDTPPGMYSRSCNPLDNRSKYDSLFNSRNPAVLRRRTVFNGFEQIDDREDYQHPRKIWLEFRAEHQENRSSKALLRKWNFHELAQGGTSTLERQTIGLRELRLNEALRIQAPELHADLLEPIGSATAEDITTNFVEGYRLPTGIERLGEHLARNAAMPMQERRGLAKSILARFAKLHTLGIAHRDITKRTLWVIEPSRVILSTFAAARIPESQTVGVHRVELETGSIDLPEDDGVDSRSRTSDPFTRDVFLLGVLVFEMLEGQELERVNRVPVYDSNAPLSVPALAPWYAKSMDWEPSARYRTATEALDALNDCLSVDTGPDVLAADFEVYKTEASPFNLPANRVISDLAGKMVYESERDGARVLVKCWQKLTFDAKYDARNLRLLAFLRQARSLRQSGFDAAPEVLDFGLGPFGLMLVTRWVDGLTLPEWLATEPDARSRARVAHALLNCVQRLHVLGLSHGDVKAVNVVVATGQEGDDIRVVLVDIPDLSADGDEGMTVGMVPPALESASPRHRDAYAVCMLVLQLLSDDFAGTREDVKRAVELTEALPPLDLLAETLQDELDPKPPVALAFEAVLKRRGRPLGMVMDVVPNNGEFSVRVTRNRETGHLRFIVVGIQQALSIKFDPKDEVVLDASVSNVEHHEYVHAYRTKNFSLNAALRVSFAEELDVARLANHLFQRHHANAADETAVEEAPASEATPVAGADPYARSGGGTPLKVISASALWTALANTDEMNVTAITVRSGVKQVPPETGNWLIPFDCEGGVFDFSEDETIELVERRVDPQDGNERWFTVATVLPDIGKDLMKARAHSMRFSPRDGSVYYVRGTLEKVASERRVAAMKRVLADGALISRMVDYFDPDMARMPRQSNDIGQLDLDEYDLNPTQEEALRTAISYGPVSLLQGPPGTGKTKFIASFVHLLLSRALAGNILVVSQSHEAVNNVMEKVAGLVRRSELDVAMVRIGLQSMVSPALRSIQEDSIRQSYREQFDAEAKVRVRAVGQAMGLPKAYVQAATDIHTTLGALLQRIDQLSDSASEPTASSEEHIQRLRSVFVELASRLSVQVSASDDFGDALQRSLDDLALDHGSPSPAKCTRLGQIARLSTEFSQVLRSPRSNFTAYLARCVGADLELSRRADTQLSQVTRLLALLACGPGSSQCGSSNHRHKHHRWLTPAPAPTFRAPKRVLSERELGQGDQHACDVSFEAVACPQGNRHDILKDDRLPLFEQKATKVVARMRSVNEQSMKEADPAQV